MPLRIKRQNVMSKKWTEERIASDIMEIANKFSPARMPTRSEVSEMTQNEALANAINKSGGFNYWADRLGLEQKYSETTLGIEGEKTVAGVLESKGFEVKLTSVKHPYDILVDGCVKVDVKTANTSLIRGCPVHAYRLAKRDHTCDFYVFFEHDTLKTYIVPACKCQGQVQVEMGNSSRLYAKYLGAFHLIKEASDMYRGM